MDPFLQSTVAKNRQCLPPQSIPMTVPPSNTGSNCQELHTPDGVYRLQQDWLIPYVIPQFAIGTHVNTAWPSQSHRILGLPTSRACSTTCSLSDIIYGSASPNLSTAYDSYLSQAYDNGSHTQQSSTPSPPEIYINQPMTAATQHNSSTTTSSSSVNTTANNSQHRSLTSHTSQSTDIVTTTTTTMTTNTTSDTLTTMPSLSVENSISEDTSKLSLVGTDGSAGSFSSIFSGHWRQYHHHSSQHHPLKLSSSSSSSGLRPKNIVSKHKSSLIENVQIHDKLSKILAHRNDNNSFVFFNVGACFLWMDSQTKDYLTCITFSRSIPTCHDINGMTLSNDHLDIIIGFSTGDCMWYDPLCSRYTRFNKHGLLHKAKVTDIKWVPGSENLFTVAFNDGVVLVMDRDREDQPFILADNKTTHSYQFVVTKPHSKYNRYNPVSHWQVNQKGVTAFEFSNDGSLIALVGSDGLLRIFDFNEERLYDVFSCYFGKLLCVAWSPDNKYILTGGQDDLVTIWSLTDQRIIARCQGHRSWVTGVAFDPKRCDGKVYRFASVGEDCKLILWDFSTNTLHKPKRNKLPLSSSSSSSSPNKESVNNRLGKLSRASLSYHCDMKACMKFIPQDQCNYSDDDDDNDSDRQDHKLKLYATATVKTHHKKSSSFSNPKSRFFTRGRRSEFNHTPSSHPTVSHGTTRLTVHPPLDQAHVPLLQPRTVRLIHQDPCIDVVFDDDGSIITTDRRGCVRKWCK